VVAYRHRAGGAYDGEKELLDLVGDPSKFQVRMKNSIGDDFHASAGQLSTKEDQTEEDEYSKFGKSYGTFADRDSADDPRGAPTTKPGDPKTDPKKTPPPVAEIRRRVRRFNRRLQFLA